MNWPVNVSSRPWLVGFFFKSRSAAEARFIRVWVGLACDGWRVRNQKIVPAGELVGIIADCWRPFGLLEAR